MFATVPAAAHLLIARTKPAVTHVEVSHPLDGIRSTVVVHRKHALPAHLRGYRLSYTFGRGEVKGVRQVAESLLRANRHLHLIVVEDAAAQSWELRYATASC